MFALGTIVAEADKIDDPKERQKYLTLMTTQLALGFAQFGKYAEQYSEAIEGPKALLASSAGQRQRGPLNGIQQLMSGF